MNDWNLETLLCEVSLKVATNFSLSLSLSHRHTDTHIHIHKQVMNNQKSQNICSKTLNEKSILPPDNIDKIMTFHNMTIIVYKFLD